MKKNRLYIDTSVLGGLLDTEEPKRVNTAQMLLDLIKEGVYEGFISHLTIMEVFKAPDTIREILQTKISETVFRILEETQESVILAEAYL